MSLPWLSNWTVAASSARRSGWCIGARMTPVPISIRDVAWASAALDDEERRHVPVVDEVVFGRPDRAEAEALGVDRQADDLVIGPRPVRLTGAKLRAQESDAQSHAGDDSSRRGFATSARSGVDTLRLGCIVPSSYITARYCT